MAARHNSLFRRIALCLGFLLPFAGVMEPGLAAQTPAPAPAAATIPPKLGTVKAVSGSAITVATDAGPTVTINVPDGARVQQLAVGSTDLKTAKPAQFADIAVGDRVLAAVKAGDTSDSFVAKQVVVMKSADIAQMQAAQQADWRARGMGGIVSAVDAAAGTVTITSGAKKVVITTTSKTQFKRFASDSVQYQDAKPGTIAQIQVKDQLQARGTKSADGLSMQAEEVLSGSFEDLSGLILSADATAGTITLKDLATKKVVTVTVTANSELRNMPAQMATRFAAQTNGSAGAQAGGGAGGAGGGGYGGGGTAGGGGGGMRRPAGADLSQMIPRFPAVKLTDLHKGDAVMIVASEPAPGTSTVTAITVLTGVDAILTANPNGGMNLSSWSIGGGGGGEQ
jgi:hypothetical protein